LAVAVGDLDDAALVGQQHVAAFDGVAHLQRMHLAVVAADEGGAPQGGDGAGFGLQQDGHGCTW
jgi:hypothetical protein